MSLKNCYQILGVSRHASGSEIRAAYLNLAKIWHPDRTVSGTGRGASKDDCEKIFAEIQDAYRQLADPKKRREHDARLFGVVLLVGEEPRFPWISVVSFGALMLWYVVSPQVFPSRVPVVSEKGSPVLLSSLAWTQLFVHARFLSWLWHWHKLLLFSDIFLLFMLIFTISKLLIYWTLKTFFPVERHVYRGNILSCETEENVSSTPEGMNHPVRGKRQGTKDEIFSPEEIVVRASRENKKYILRRG